MTTEAENLRKAAFRIFGQRLPPELEFSLALADFCGRSTWNQQQWEYEKHAKRVLMLLHKLARLDQNPLTRRTQAVVNAMNALYQEIDWVLAQLARGWASAQQAGGKHEVERVMRGISQDWEEENLFEAEPF